MIKLPTILPPPDCPPNLDKTVKWLAGEGAGSWFLVEFSGEKRNEYQVRRFSPEGKLECKGIFNASASINFDELFEMGYPSHCQKITVLQGKNSITMEKIDNNV